MKLRNLFALLAILAAGPLGSHQALAADDADSTDEELAEAIAADQTAPSPLAALNRIVPLNQMNPKLSLILNTALGWYSDADHIRQGGHAADENGFALQGVELAASASVDPYFRFDLNFELAHLHIEEAYMTTLSLPFNLQSRAGYFNAAFGRQNTQHLHMWTFINPSLAHSRFLAEEHFSGLGLELSYLVPLPWYVLFTVQAFDTNPETRMRSSTFARVDVSESGELDGPEDLVYVARLENFFALGPDWSLKLGVHGAWGQSPHVPDNRATLYGTDLYIKWRPISQASDALAVALTAEYMLRDTQVPGDSVRDHGGYLQLDAQLTRRWMVGLRADNTSHMEGWVDDAGLMGWQWRGSAVVTFLPTHFSKLRLQYDVQRQRGMDGPAHAVFLQVEVAAGAHGAHKF